VVHELVKLCQIGPSTQKPGIWPPKLANPFTPGQNAKTSLVFADVAYPCRLGPSHLSKTPLILSLVHVDWTGGSNGPRRCGPAAGGAAATRVRVWARARGQVSVPREPHGARPGAGAAAVARAWAHNGHSRSGKRWWGTTAAASQPSMTSEESVTTSDGGGGREALEPPNLFV
jgi:hypothetical protein